MTENQRNYLADLAGRKGVRIESSDNISQAEASRLIDELKALPDKDFPEPTAEELAEVKNLTNHAIEELHKWNFAE